jgi:zinc protease
MSKMEGLIGAPAPSEPRAFRPPVTAESRLSNGIRVIVATRRNVPLIGMQVLFPGGGANDPLDSLGRSSLAATLLSYGPENSTSEAFAASLDAIGARFSGGSSYDGLSAGTSSLTHLFRDALQLCNQAICKPGFAQADLERVRARVLSDLRLSYGSANSLAKIITSRALYGASPYGKPISGVPETIESMTRESIVVLAQSRIRPERATVIMCGDIGEEEAFALAQERFGAWVGPNDVPLEVPQAAFESSQIRKGRVIVVDLPDSGRSSVMLGHITIARDDPRYSASLVTMGLLSGYSGRLNREIRVKRGLSYGAAAQIQARLRPGPFFASTLVDHAKTGETVDVMLEVLNTLAVTEPTEAELAPRKAMLRGSFGRILESVSGLAGALAELALNDLPLSEYDGYLERIEAVTPSQVSDFARAFLVDEPTIVVVGDASIILPQLVSKFPQVETYSAPGLRILEV